MFIAQNKVRMHDTDMAGILYFARQFRFAHDALEDFVESEGLSFNQVFHKENFVFVIVHVEADYHAPLQVGDLLEVHLEVEHIGNSSFSLIYHIYRKPPRRGAIASDPLLMKSNSNNSMSNLGDDGVLVGTAKTVHVTLDATTRKKIPVPEVLHERLKAHLIKKAPKDKRT